MQQATTLILMALITEITNITATVHFPPSKEVKTNITLMLVTIQFVLNADTLTQTANLSTVAAMELVTAQIVAAELMTKTICIGLTENVTAEIV